jgi:hypothetical protein
MTTKLGLPFTPPAYTVHDASSFGSRAPEQAKISPTGSPPSGLMNDRARFPATRKPTSPQTPAAANATPSAAQAHPPASTPHEIDAQLHEILSLLEDLLKDMFPADSNNGNPRVGNMAPREKDIQLCEKLLPLLEELQRGIFPADSNNGNPQASPTSAAAPQARADTGPSPEKDKVPSPAPKWSEPPGKAVSPPDAPQKRSAPAQSAAASPARQPQAATSGKRTSKPYTGHRAGQLGQGSERLRGELVWELEKKTSQRSDSSRGLPPTQGPVLPTDDYDPAAYARLEKIESAQRHKARKLFLELDKKTSGPVLPSDDYDPAQLKQATLESIESAQRHKAKKLFRELRASTEHILIAERTRPAELAADALANAYFDMYPKGYGFAERSKPLDNKPEHTVVTPWTDHFDREIEIYDNLLFERDEQNNTSTSPTPRKDINGLIVNLLKHATGDDNADHSEKAKKLEAELIDKFPDLINPELKAEKKLLLPNSPEVTFLRDSLRKFLPQDTPDHVNHEMAACNKQFETWLKDNNMRAVPNRGTGNNCLIVSLLCHATGNYNDNDADLEAQAAMWRKALKAKFPELGKEEMLKPGSHEVTFLLDCLGAWYPPAMQIAEVWPDHDGIPRLLSADANPKFDGIPYSSKKEQLDGRRIAPIFYANKHFVPIIARS